MISTLDKKLLRGMRDMKAQIVAIVLVMATGIATFVMSVGIIDSLELSLKSYYDEYRFGDIFVGVKRAPESLVNQLEAIPGVSRIMTRVILRATLDIEGMIEPATAMLVSLPEGGQPSLNGLHLRSGRLVEPYRDNEVVVADTFAEAHDLQSGDEITATISGHQRTLKVVGVALSPEFLYVIPPGGLMPDNARFGILWMGRNALEAAHDMDGAFNDVVIKLSLGASEQEVIRKVDELTQRYGGLGAFSRDDHVSDMFIRNEITQLEAMAFLLPIIFLAIAGFLTHMVLARLIALEREQIGVLKAIGFSNAQVAMHYMKFSLVIGLAAAVIGIILGLWIGQGMANIYAMFFRFPALHFVYAPGVMILAVLIALGASMLGAWRAARAVVRLPAAEAMRPEPPPSFRPVLAERLGLTRFISPVGRMILRQLERRGRRSFFTSVGIGSSLGILIAASFTLDSLDFVLDIQFNQSEREDIGIALTEAGSRQAYHDLAHLPGVLRAEPYRSVPVKIKAGQLTKRTTLLGLEPDGDLHRMLDIGLNPVPIAPQGVVLNERLAQDLQVGPGDRLTIEALVGRRPTMTVYVASVVQQYLSTGAFMDLSALNALMQEGPSVTGAWLSVDEARMPSFFAAVKNTPAISGLSIRKAAIESFRKMLADNIVQISLANIGFAALIIFGVVYNSARISLSERARELASMRVLGFSRAEISTILLGELAILVFAAIPIGYLMGYGLAQGIVISMDTELFRIPLVIDRDTYGWTALVVLVAAALSGLVVRRRLDHLNLVEVLKSRE